MSTAELSCWLRNEFLIELIIWNRCDRTFFSGFLKRKLLLPCRCTCNFTMIVLPLFLLSFVFISGIVIYSSLKKTATTKSSNFVLKTIGTLMRLHCLRCIYWFRPTDNSHIGPTYIYKFINILFDNDSNISFSYENDNFFKSQNMAWYVFIVNL